MDLQVFRSFVKTAVALQMDGSDQTPPGYHEARAAVRNRYPDLERGEPRSEKYDPESLKLAMDPGTVRHVSEMVNLGILGAPSAAELGGAHVSDRKKQVSEVVGLGGLAAPYAHDLAMKSPRYAGSAVGRGINRVIGNGLHNL